MYFLIKYIIFAYAPHVKNLKILHLIYWKQAPVPPFFFLFLKTTQHKDYIQVFLEKSIIKLNETWSTLSTTITAGVMIFLRFF